MRLMSYQAWVDILFEKAEYQRIYAFYFCFFFSDNIAENHISNTQAMWTISLQSQQQRQYCPRILVHCLWNGFEYASRSGRLPLHKTCPNNFFAQRFLICSFPYETKMLILLKINNKSTRMSSCGVFPVILLSLLRSTSIVNSLSFLFNIFIFLKNKLALLSLWGRGLTEKGKNDTAGCPLTHWFKEPTRKVLKIKQNQSEFHYPRSKV